MRVTILLSFLVILFQATSSHCPNLCKCSQLDRMLIVTCSASNVTETLSVLPNSTTHLLITIKENPPIPLGTVYDLDFSALSDLEVLLLEGGHLVPPSAHIGPDSLDRNGKLRVLGTHLTDLDFTETSLFKLEHLEELIISNMKGDWDFMKALVEHSLANKSRLHKLSLQHMTLIRKRKNYCDYLTKFNPHDIFGALNNSQVTELDLSDNGFRMITPSFSKVFNMLERLDISANILYDGMMPDISDWISDFLRMSTLRDLDVSSQGQPVTSGEQFTKETLLSFTTKPGQTPVPKRETGSTFRQRDARCFLHVCLPLGKLEVLNWSNQNHDAGNFVYEFLKSGHVTMCFESNNYLRYVDISHLEQWKLDVRNVKILGLNRLKTLNVQYFDAREFNRDTYTDMIRLETLLLGGNHLGPSLSKSGDALYLEENQALHVLDLAFNEITTMPTEQFSNNIHLRQLNLSGNYMEVFNINLSSLLQLQVLNLSSNRLSYLSAQTTGQLDAIRDSPNCTDGLVLDLSDNPLTCGCSYMDFVSWLQDTSVTLHDNHTYMCHHPYMGLVRMLEIDLDDLQHKCFPSNTKIVVMSVLLSSAVTVLLVLVLSVYCKRWKLRYWWYIMQRGWKRMKDDTDLTHYNYDVFVAYNWRDGRWVHGPLLEELEVKRGMRLCIHQRDFLPGEVLEEVIVDKIQTSRKTLLVLTPHFIESNWCHFELQMARCRLFEEGRDVLILVLLSALPNASISKTLYQLLKRKVYLEWTENTEGQGLFWQKLADAVNSDSVNFGVNQ